MGITIIPSVSVSDQVSALETKVDTFTDSLSPLDGKVVAVDGKVGQQLR